ICVSAKAVFSKYSIQPDSPIDFGALIKGSKKSQVIILENKGTLSFKYFIHQAPSLEENRPKGGLLLARGVQVMAVRHQLLLALFLQAQLTLGMFTVSPCSGSVAPCGQQKITVDCNAGPEGKCEEHLSIDVCGR
ncbi:HYDIN protein, partial [Campylorhamphus procurvoides]|nr:HYDIN protein [Campylorhamphus procurvoides]